MSGQIKDLLTHYRQWLDGIDAAFDAARQAAPGAVPCHGGCSHCCYTLFAIPAMDGFLLWEGLQQQGQAVAQAALARCERLFLDFKAHACPSATIPFRVEHFGWTAFDAMVETFQRPCPFLTEDGWCGIYRWRPRICRLAGVVFKDLCSGIILEDFCPLASDARMETGFAWAPFDISGMDMQVMEFRQQFQAVLQQERSIALPSGMTFPAAGVLEASQRPSK